MVGKTDRGERAWGMAEQGGDRGLVSACLRLPGTSFSEAAITPAQALVEEAVSDF